MTTQVARFSETLRALIAPRDESESGRHCSSSTSETGAPAATDASSRLFGPSDTPAANSKGCSKLPSEPPGSRPAAAKARAR